MIVRIIILVLVNFLLLAEVGETCDLISDPKKFSAFMKTKLYVDKTGLLIDFISGEIDEAVYAAAPRRFGKTTNNLMIKTFFHVSFEENGYTLIKDKTKDPRYQNLKTTTNLEVVQNEKFFEKHFGNYIVVYITLSDYGEFESEQDLKWKLFNSIFTDGFLPFKEWWNLSGCKTKIHKQDDTCYDYLTDMFARKFINVVWHKAFSCLFKNLRKYYQKEVILIVDEFDKSIIDSLRYLNYDTAERILRFLGNTFGGLSKIPEAQDADPRYPVFRALFTGITHLPIGPGSAQMSNVEVYPYFEKNPLSKYYGFNQTEVDILLQRYNLEDKKDDLKEFYDGYKIIGTDWQRYNPLSVVKFIKNGVIKSYWQKTNTVGYWFQFCHNAEVLHNIELFAFGKNASLDIVISDSIEDLKTMMEVLDICESPKHELKLQIDIRNKHRTYFFKYLLQEGYLTPVEWSGNDNILYAAPNTEIQQEFIKIYAAYASDVVHINLNNVATVFWSIAHTCSINQKFIKELKENFNRLVNNRIENEADFHYNEQALRSMVFISCAYKSVTSRPFSSPDQFVFAEVKVESVAFIDIKWTDTQTIRYGLDDKKYGKADVYLKLNHGETIVMIEFKIGANGDEAAKQVMGYRPRLEDQGECKKLVLVWVVIPQPKTVKFKDKGEIKVSVGCYVFKNYDAKNPVAPVAQICADPESPFKPGTVPRDFFLTAISDP